MSSGAPSTSAFPFHRHPWPYPSAVSLATCLSRINVLNRDQVLKFWGQGRTAQGIALDSLPAAGCRAALRLTSAELRAAFEPAWWWPAALNSMSPAFGDPIRFCSDCLRGGYHTLLFQLPWWVRCPIHGCLLLRTCPTCGGALNGLRLRAQPAVAFQCSHCSRDLVSTGAIIAASRRGVATQLHHLVGLHRRWCHAVSDAFVVHPVLMVPNCEITSQWVCEWLRASKVPWPDALQPFVMQADSLPRRGVRLSRVPPLPNDLDALGALNRIAEENEDQEPSGIRRFPVVARPVARALAQLDERLRDAAGEGGAGSHSSDAEALRHDSQLRAVGLRRRDLAMRFEQGGNGEARLWTVQPEWSELGSHRLLCLLANWLNLFQDNDSLYDACTVVNWWMSHLLAITLTDATAAAIHAGAWMPQAVPQRTLVSGWPRVELDRHAPGHSWVLAATICNGQMDAFLEPVSLTHLVRSDAARVRDLYDALERDTIAFANAPL